MASWNKEWLPKENGEQIWMQVPEIVSASRSTDIPAFYADWFFHRLKVGYSAWTNPFNGTKSYVSYKNTRFIVFWSKNPKPLLGHLDKLRDRNIGCYLQYTLNDYEKEGLEIKTVESSLFGTEPVPAGAIRLSETQYALKKRDNRDKGQRQFCGCILSKDIGEYNTCPHLCEYCYANASKEVAVRNWKEHKMNPLGETITGK